MKRRAKAQPSPADQIPPAIVPALQAWFARSARDLPWRITTSPAGTRNPYHVLVSEVMLQQTQVSRVVEKFHAFLDRFPDVASLAQAPEDDVLAAWTGLGYYRRARLLHACAIAIVDRHQGQIPKDIDALRALPGIGAYTAGAIASLAFAQPQPLVDTNVARVLLRIAGKHLAVTDKDANSWAWDQARALVEHAHASTTKVPNHAGAWNESLMELGATVCVLPMPRCMLCPVQRHCSAYQTGSTQSIPLPSRKAARSAITHLCLLLKDAQGRVLVEQRTTTPSGGGLWAGLWQLPTLEAPPESDPNATPPAIIAHALNLPIPRPYRWHARDPFVFKTTHRDVHFLVYELLSPALAPALAGPSRRWCDQTLFATLAWSSPMRRLVLDALTR